MSTKTPEQIAEQATVIASSGWHLEPLTEHHMALIASAARLAVEKDRADRRPEIHIVQDDTGAVLDVFRDSDEAEAAYGHRADVSTIEETIWEPGEYAAQRIATLTAEWEDSTGDVASDYMLSEDDWSVGLNTDEAAEIARLTDYTKESAA